MIVASNTSPITNLAAIGQLDLLRALYEKIYIPRAVLSELSADGTHWPGYAQVCSADWVSAETVRDRALVRSLLRDLDLGESESIALALELGADLVVLDEIEGRRIARRVGLRVIGVAGVLLEAKSNGLVSIVRTNLDALRSTAGFYVSDAFYNRVLVLADEI